MGKISGQAVFIVGTDTDVGKTHVAAQLLKALNQSGIRAGGFKPCESGCSISGGRLIPADALILKEAGRMSEGLDIINPYSFKEPLAPGVAAEREGVKISFPVLRRKLDLLRASYELVLIEGAGGLLVPVSGKKTNLELIRYLKVPVVVVGRLGLGTINHTLLTVETLKRAGIAVLHVILNQTDSLETVSSQTNPDVIRKFLKIPVSVMPLL